MCNSIINFSTWLEANTGQIQIYIGLMALFIAVFAYFKVLKQIKISDNQTYLTIEQMKKISEERIFELKLKLTSRIGYNLQQIREIQEKSNDLSGRIQVLLILTEQDYQLSLNTIQSVATDYRIVIQQAWDMVRNDSARLRDVKQQIPQNYDLKNLEILLMSIEENQFQYDSMLYQLNDLDKSVDGYWNGLKTGDALEAARISKNFI